MTLTDRSETTRITRRPTKSRPSRPPLVAGVVLILVGLLWLLERVGAMDISVTAVLALATMVTGISLMVLAGEGSHGGLVVLGAILGLVTLLTAAAPFEGFQGGIGDVAVEVTSVDDLQADYNVAMGKLVIDLRQLDGLAAVTPVSASVGTGELIVRVPDNTPIRIDANVGAGEIDILGRTTDGIGVDQQYESPGFNTDSPGLTLELRVFAGRVEVTDE